MALSGQERREQIIKILKQSDKPIPGTELAKRMEVSRQVVVQDMALIRANGIEITSTNRGYIIQDENNVFFVNKADSNKIYRIGKDGNNMGALADIKGVSDKGNIKEVDGRKYMFISGNKLYYINTDDSNTLWSINLEDKTTEKVIYSSVQILQNVDNTVFFKVKNEMGVYLYNYDTKFMSKITNRNVSEFSIDGVADNTNEVQLENLEKK